MVQITQMYDDRVKFLAIREELRQMVQSQFPDKDLQREIWIGSIKPFDAHYFARVLRKYKPATILEVGSYIGLSSRWILEVTQPWKSRITCVDPNIPHWSFQDPRQIRMQFLQKFAAENRVKNITGFYSKIGKGINNEVTAEMIASTPIVANQINDSFDMIFLDGDHTYEVVKEDLKASLKLLNPGGVIVFHDAISWSGVARLMREQKANYKIRVSGNALNVVGKAIANKGMDGIAVLET